MSKGQNVKKSSLKKPASTMQEKKAVKREKKLARNNDFKINR